MKLIIVDDSAVYRNKIRAALSESPWIEIVGVASNGKIALDLLEKSTVDLITLDMEMPIMDGITTLREIKKRNIKTKAIVFSSCTSRGAEITMDALEAGAYDFVTKPNMKPGDTVTPEEMIRKELLPKLQEFHSKKSFARSAISKSELTQARLVPGVRKDIDTFLPSAIVIASSTGGPSANESVFEGLGLKSGGKLRCPIFITQHMPPLFTTSFAKRLSDFSKIPCKEAVHGEKIQNQIYVAPGDFHLTLKKESDQNIYTLLDQKPPRNSVRPAADPMFESAAQVYGSRLMGFILTGMGEDGLVGAKAIKAIHGGIMIQSPESCVVFGMPGAILNAGLHDAIGSLEEIRKQMSRMSI